MYKLPFPSLIMMMVLTSCSGGGNTTGEQFTGTSYPAQIDRTEVTATGTVFYIDPAAGTIGNDGSATAPWNTLQAVIEGNKIESREPTTYPHVAGAPLKVKNVGAPVKPGDTLVLKAGHHGNVKILKCFNPQYINVIAEPGATVAELHLQAGSNWRFKGLTVRPNPGNTIKYNLVHLESHNWSGPVTNITVDDFTIQSVADAATAWSTNDPADWNNLSCHGIMASGDNITLRRNSLKNIDFGITVSGNYAMVYGNTIENFAGDGLRGLGNDLFFEYNTVKNCYAVNANHDDGFQSWSINGDPPRERVVLRGNTIINATDPNQPFKGSVQGIGCFDGWYIDWIVENNLIITDHWHGISLYGARNCRIVNNTAIGQTSGASTGPPWVGFFKHKDGSPNSNCVVRNNIARTIQADAGTTEDHNFRISGYATYPDIFINHLNLDLRLKPGAAAIDAGSALLAPPIDISGTARPRGTAVDIGAYEQ